MIPTWMMNPLFSLAAGPVAAAAARMVLGEDPLPHEKAMLNRCQRGMEEAGVLMGALAEFDANKPFTLYPALRDAHSRLKTWRHDNQLRNGNNATRPPSSPAQEMIALWVQEKFGSECPLQLLVDLQVEWVFKGLLPDATLRQEVKNPFEVASPASDLLPAFLLRDAQFKKAVIRAWVLPSQDWVLVETAPPEEAKVQANYFTYWLCFKGDLASANPDEGYEVLRRWVREAAWGATHKPSTPYWCSRLSLGRDYSKGEQSRHVFDGFGHCNSVFEKKGPPSRQFKGEGGSYVDQWQSFMEKGHRRAVLLYGPPGGGKTTLLLDAMQTLGTRKLELCAWHKSDIIDDILKGLNPDVLLMEDLDRWDPVNLSNVIMPLLESKPAKLILATCNDFRKLPQAMRRPGRFDQMIHIQAPDREGRRAIMIRHALSLGSTIPEEVQDQLLIWSEGMTGAFLCEMVNRGVVLGWDRHLIFPPLDATHLQAVPGIGEEEADLPPPPSDPSPQLTRRREMPEYA